MDELRKVLRFNALWGPKLTKLFLQKEPIGHFIVNYSFRYYQVGSVVKNMLVFLCWPRHHKDLLRFCLNLNYQNCCWKTFSILTTGGRLTSRENVWKISHAEVWTIFCNENLYGDRAKCPRRDKPTQSAIAIKSGGLPSLH